MSSLPTPEFNWNSPVKKEVQNMLEIEIYEIIKDQKDDIWPCHPDSVIVFLGISGAFDEKLSGEVKCKECNNKILMKFEGDAQASNLELTIYKTRERGKKSPPP
jgi:predicted RNA-binding protein (virulence factor B family)